MKKILTKLTLAILAFSLCGVTLLMTEMPVTVSANTNISGLDDDSEVKDYICINGYPQVPGQLTEYNNRLRASGWDINEIGGTAEMNNGIRLIDESAELPVEGTREFESATYGELEWYYGIRAESGLKDAAVMLREGSNHAIKVGFDEQYIWLDMPQGRKNLLTYKTNVEYIFYIPIHLDKGTFDVYIDYQLYAEGIPLGAKTVDNVCFTTGKQTVGNLTIGRINLRRGYWLYEDFTWGSGAILPPGLTLRTTNQKTGAVSNAPVSYESNGILIDTATGETWFQKLLGTQTRDFNARCYLRILKNCRDAQVLFKNGEETLFKFYADGKNFYYLDASGAPVKCYDNYKDDLWYSVDVKVSLSNHTFDLSVDDKVMATNVPLRADISSVDTFMVGGSRSDDVFYLDNIEVYPDEPVEDYVPQPHPADSEGLDVGMEYFGLWQEGLHFGWDPINDSDYRRPLDGFYDEYSIEHWDWQIKYWVEHGIDFIAPCWYAANPVWDSEVCSQYDEKFFRAKYSDMMKIALLMEISGWPTTSNPEESVEKWLRNVGRQVIEYYFKDPRYYTNGGRPVLYIFGADALTRGFGSLAPELIQRWGDMCEAEGVGRPLIFLHSEGSSDGRVENTMQLAESLGVEGVYHYHATTGGWPQDTIATNLRHYNMVTEKNMLYVPTLDTGYDHYAWYNKNKVNYAMDDAQWQYELQQFKEKYLPLPSKLETPIAMVTNWNEWGEGHFLGPCEGYGFSRLDALRKYLTNAGPHEDVTPNDHQKDRFNNAYPWWRTTHVREVNVGETPAPEAYEKYVWNFDDKSSMGWQKINSALDDKVEDGMWKLTTGNDIAIKLTDSNIDTANVTHIRLRVRNKGGGYSVYTDLTTPFWNTTSTGRTIHTGMLNQYTDEITEHYIPVGKYPEFWRGILDGMQIIIDGYQPGETLEIDSIAFMALPQKEETTLTIDGWSEGTPAVMQNGMPMLPLRSVTWRMKGEIYYDSETKKVWVDSDGRISSFVPGEDTVECAGETYTLPSSSIMKDGATYVDTQMLSVIFQKGAAWDALEKKLTLSDNTQSFVPSRPNTERKLIWSNEFTNDTGLYYWNNMSDVTVNDGVLEFVTSSTDPQMVMTPNVDVSEAQLITIGVRADAACRTQVFFATDMSADLSENKSYFVHIAASGDIIEYTFDPRTNSMFGGVLQQLRVDLGDNPGVKCGVDYIRIYGDFDHELTEEEIADRYNSADTSGEDIVWNFDLNTRKDGWLLSKSLANAGLLGGVLTADIICTNPFIETAQSNLDLEAATHHSVKLCMRTPTGATRAKLYFTTDRDEEWTESKCVEIPLTYSGTSNIVYTADMSANANWSGKIKALRLMIPDVRRGVFGVDFVRVVGNRVNTEK